MVYKNKQKRQLVSDTKVSEKLQMSVWRVGESPLQGLCLTNSYEIFLRTLECLSVLKGEDAVLSATKFFRDSGALKALNMFHNIKIPLITLTLFLRGKNG